MNLSVTFVYRISPFPPRKYPQLLLVLVTWLSPDQHTRVATIQYVIKGLRSNIKLDKVVKGTQIICDTGDTLESHGLK